MCNTKFYVCSHCGNIVGMIHDAGVPLMCCGQKMQRLEAGTSDASKEKHVPIVELKENEVRVSVGSIAHPMTSEHHIAWVYLQTDRGGQRKCLNPDSEPTVSFALKDETPVAVYAYCNLHGLWAADAAPKPVCDLKPVDTKSVEDFTICNCNKVTYFDILNALNNSHDIHNALEGFESVKNTTHCSTGCGGCYERVLKVISDAMSGETK
ncbi:MAG: (2Fe-2S)-binding protein [Clostridia bacterium]|nr:(2Fe-2S)-binding protein [Clostridia bacterium]